MCPLSPSIPNQSPGGDDGWANLGDAPIQVENSQAADAALSEGLDADVVDGEDGVEAQMPRGVPPPPEPHPSEVARHNLTHYPYRSWCPHCLASRRPNSHHRRAPSSLARRNIPLFCADYCFVKDSDDVEMLPVLAGQLYPRQTILATGCKSKGIDDYTIGRLTNFVKESGVPRLVYKSDQENAIV